MRIRRRVGRRRRAVDSCVSVAQTRNPRAAARGRAGGRAAAGRRSVAGAVDLERATSGQYASTIQPLRYWLTSGIGNPSARRTRGADAPAAGVLASSSRWIARAYSNAGGPRCRGPSAGSSEASASRCVGVCSASRASCAPVRRSRAALATQSSRKSLCGIRPPRGCEPTCRGRARLSRAHVISADGT